MKVQGDSYIESVEIPSHLFYREALLEDYGSETWTCPICDISFFDASSPEIKFVTHLGVAHDLVKKYLANYLSCST